MFNQEKLERKIKIRFNSTSLCQLAFVHKSYVNENQRVSKSNERLEFLGDAVLELVVTTFLFHEFSEKPEGELTALRSALVKGQNLAEVALKLNLGEHLYLSKGEENSGGRTKDFILANVMEALIGAIYLDSGYDSAKKFIHTFILNDIDNQIAHKFYIDAKSLFQEKAQEIENTTPEYKLIKSSGPDHNKTFTMGLYLQDTLVTTGKGSSKQKAEQDAAEKGLEIKSWLEENTTEDQSTDHPKK